MRVAEPQAKRRMGCFPQLRRRRGSHPLQIVETAIRDEWSCLQRRNDRETNQRHAENETSQSCFDSHRTQSDSRTSLISLAPDENIAASGQPDAGRRRSADKMASSSAQPTDVQQRTSEGARRATDTFVCCNVMLGPTRPSACNGGVGRRHYRGNSPFTYVYP